MMMLDKTEKGRHARQSSAGLTGGVLGNAAVALHCADLRQKGQAPSAKPGLSTTVRLRFRNDIQMSTTFEPRPHWMLKTTDAAMLQNLLLGIRR
jgi:hypothetical protein